MLEFEQKYDEREKVKYSCKSRSSLLLATLHYTVCSNMYMYVIVQATTYSKSDFGLHTCSHTTTQRGIVYIITSWMDAV